MYFTISLVTVVVENRLKFIATVDSMSFQYSLCDTKVHVVTKQFCHFRLSIRLDTQVLLLLNDNRFIRRCIYKRKRVIIHCKNPIITNRTSMFQIKERTQFETSKHSKQNSHLKALLQSSIKSSHQTCVTDHKRSKF